MREITLTQGLVALVDDDVFDELNQFKWCAQRDSKTFYAVRTIRVQHRRVLLKMHRHIMEAPHSVAIDHIDHDGLNNRRSNLRFCTTQQNGFNRQLQNDNTSGFKGVSFHRRKGKWQAALNANGKCIFLGLFPTPEEAARAYDAGAVAHFGEFACLNFPVAVPS